MNFVKPPKLKYFPNNVLLSFIAALKPALPDLLFAKGPNLVQKRAKL